MRQRKGIGFRLFSIFLILFFSVSTAESSQRARDYQRALTQFEALVKDPRKRGLREHWALCVNNFQSVLVAEPTGPWADDALFMTGRVYATLYGFSSNPYDRKEAIDYLGRLVKRFPQTPYKEQALKAITELRRDEAREMARTKPSKGPLKLEKKRALVSGKMRTSQKAASRATISPATEVKAVRFWSSATYARVVVDLKSEASFSHRLVREGPGRSGPEARLLIEVHDARIGPRVKPFAPAPDTLLSGARAIQHGPDKVHVLLRVKSLEHFKVFSLPDPFRIVVDVRSVPLKTASKKRFKGDTVKVVPKVPEGALAKQLALGVHKIVIDPGHGGEDFGAKGYLKGMFEKNVTLEISHRLAKKIRERLGCEAILTRREDVFLSLEERTARANTVGADLFISIHTNAHKKMASRGIETYFLNLATDERAILVAARENAASAKNLSDLEGILSDLMTQAKQDESSRLAGHVQNALVETLSSRFGRVKDKGVKQAPFYVLLGAEMPCILIEVSFITNPRECRRLNTADYQETIADGVVEGIRGYVKENQSPGRRGA